MREGSESAAVVEQTERGVREELEAGTHARLRARGLGQHCSCERVDLGELGRTLRGRDVVLGEGELGRGDESDETGAGEGRHLAREVGVGRSREGGCKVEE